jgi:hypothetical protein
MAPITTSATINLRRGEPAREFDTGLRRGVERTLARVAGRVRSEAPVAARWGRSAVGPYAFDGAVPVVGSVRFAGAVRDAASLRVAGA